VRDLTERIIQVTEISSSGWTDSYTSRLQSFLHSLRAEVTLLDDASDMTRVREPRLFLGVLALSTAIIIVIGVYPEPFLSLTLRIASGL